MRFTLLLVDSPAYEPDAVAEDSSISQPIDNRALDVHATDKF